MKAGRIDGPHIETNKAVIHEVLPVSKYEHWYCLRFALYFSET